MDLSAVLGAETAEHDPFDAHPGWRPGLGARRMAALVTGAGLTLVEPGVLSDRIAGLYGQPGSLAVGWLVHLGHGALFGLMFAVVLADPGLANPGHRFPASLVAGLVYGIVLAIVGMGLIMPMWLDPVGAASPSLRSSRGRSWPGT